MMNPFLITQILLYNLYYAQYFPVCYPLLEQHVAESKYNIPYINLVISSLRITYTTVTGAFFYKYI
jgi:hypothetical protein